MSIIRSVTSHPVWAAFTQTSPNRDSSPASNPSPTDLNTKGALDKTSLEKLQAELKAYQQSQISDKPDAKHAQKASAIYQRALDKAHIAETIIDQMDLDDPAMCKWYKAHPLATKEIYTAYRDSLYEDLSSSGILLSIFENSKKIETATQEVFSLSMQKTDQTVNTAIQTKVGTPTTSDTKQFERLQTATDQAAQKIYDNFAKLSPQQRKETRIPDIEGYADYIRAAQIEFINRINLDVVNPGAAMTRMQAHPDAAVKHFIGVESSIYDRLAAIDQTNKQKGLIIADHGVADSLPLGAFESHLVAATGRNSLDKKPAIGQAAYRKIIENPPKDSDLVLRQYAIEKRDGKIVIVDKLNKDESNQNKVVDTDGLKQLKQLDPELEKKLQDKLTVINAKNKEVNDSYFWEFIDKRRRKDELTELLDASTITARRITKEEREALIQPREK